jgi:hypothetical protein
MRLTYLENKMLMQFLACFNPNLNQILFNVATQDPDDPSKVRFNISRGVSSLDGLLAANEATQSDIYFYPNGGPKITDCTNINAAFIDLDAGRTNRGTYKSEASVAAFKRKAMTRINEFKFTPSLIVETRNGYHVYWLLTQPLPSTWKSRAEWNLLEQKLLSFFNGFGADPLAMRLNQLMRLPFSWWNKSQTGLAPFKCRLVHADPQLRYDLSTLLMNQSLLSIQCLSAFELRTLRRTNDWSPTGAIRTMPKAVTATRKNMLAAAARKIAVTPSNRPAARATPKQRAFSVAPTPPAAGSLATIQEAVDFLNEMAGTMQAFNKAHSAGTARRLASDLKAQHGI